jgi:hypothetical protein
MKLPSLSCPTGSDPHDPRFHAPSVSEEEKSLLVPARSVAEDNPDLSTRTRSQELAQEIAVGDLYEIRDKSGKSLVEVLRSSTQIGHHLFV